VPFVAPFIARERWRAGRITVRPFTWVFVEMEPSVRNPFARFARPKKATMLEPYWSITPNSSIEEADDRLLLKRTATGDKEAFRAFYDRYGRRVVAVIRRRVFDPQIVEELVQDVFVAVWSSAPRYRQELGEPEAWLNGLVRNKLADHWRRMRRVGVALGVGLDPSEEVGEVPRSDLRLSLERALGTLTAEQHRVVSLVYLSGLTLREAALALRTPLGTVKSRINAALRRMRAVLDERRSGAHMR
jgi:RNA polymerase sigma-70 factor, ECF subfamily